VVEILETQAIMRWLWRTTILVGQSTARAESELAAFAWQLAAASCRIASRRERFSSSIGSSPARTPGFALRASEADGEALLRGPRFRREFLHRCEGDEEELREQLGNEDSQY
jgi:hypothetical protein